MSTELIALLLLRVGCAASLAILAVLAVRLALRHVFGCGVAYGAWAAVPLVTCAVLLPVPEAHSLAFPLVEAAQPLAQAVILPIPSTPAGHWVFLSLWLAGALIFAVWQLLRQHQFERSTGQLTRHGDLARASSKTAGPALVGLIRPVIVLPLDFGQRYTPAERDLIIAHERTHARRGDPLANLIIAVYQCLGWCNPLVHLAAHLARMDQELACDADVMRAHPDAKGDYARAMLKTQLVASSIPLACQWQPIHPVKERIMQLNNNASYKARLAGRIVLALSLAVSSYATWAMKIDAAAAGNLYDIALELNLAGVKSTPKLRVQEAQQAAVSMNEGDKQWGATFVVTPAGDNRLFIKMTLTDAGKLLGQPGLLVTAGEQAEVTFALANQTKVAMRMTITPTPAPANAD